MTETKKTEDITTMLTGMAKDTEIETNMTVRRIITITEILADIGEVQRG